MTSLSNFNQPWIDAATRSRDCLLNTTDPVDIGHQMMRITFDIIVQTMMSAGQGIDVSRALVVGALSPLLRWYLPMADNVSAFICLHSRER